MGYAVAKIDAKPLRDLVRVYDLQVPDISKRTLISESALHSWIKSGKMPAYMQHVCLGLLAQIKGLGSKADSIAGKPETLIIQLPADPKEHDRAYKMLDALGVKHKRVDEFKD